MGAARAGGAVNNSSGMMSTPSKQRPSGLEAFDAQNSRDGLFARYCRGRLRSFRERHMVTLAGSGALLLFAHPALGLAVLFLALGGDLLDCAVLRWLLRRYPDGAVPPFWRALTIFTAAIQAATIALSVIFVWLSSDPGDARFFVIAYLFGSALTAGLTLVHSPAATRARMFVYFGTAVGLLVYDAVGGASETMRFGFDTVAVGIFAYMVWVYVRVTASSLRHRIAYQRALLVEKLQVEEAVEVARTSEERARLLALVAEHASDAVGIADRDGRIEYVNDAFARMAGSAADAMVGQTSGNLLGASASPETMAGIAPAMKNHEPVRTEIMHHPPAGEPIWVELSLTPIFDEAGRFVRYITVGRDVTDAKRREEELSRAKLAAEEGSRAKSNFLATMSHEIRTPMNAIIGTTDLLTESTLDTAQREHVTTILEAGEALLTIIGDVLEATRLETGQIELVTEPFDLHGCIRGVARLLDAVAAEKGLSLECQIADSCPRWVRGDAGRVRQILLNLVGNAVKFTESGFVSITADVEADGGGVIIKVQDTGIGIGEDRIAHIFEAFAQEDGDITRRFGGTGLGLTISRMLVQVMNGKIDVTSQRGVGSTFTVRLDLPREAPPSARSDHVGAEPDLSLLQDKRILVAEDNRANRILISKLLAQTGADLRFAADGVEAIALYIEFRPDAVLMDMSMPRMDGLEATREIIELQAQGFTPCPVIGLTANAFTEDRERCLAAGMTEFLSKPVRKKTLLSCLVRAISQAGAGEGRLSA